MIGYTIHHKESTSTQDGRTAYDVAKDSATAALLQEAQERLQQREKLLHNAYAVDECDDDDDADHNYDEAENNDGGQAAKRHRL